MKDFVREYWRSAAAGAAGSFLLSLLVGLVTRNPFGVVFMRALLLAALFACLAAALRYLIRTHLLEKAGEGAAPHAGGAARDDGRGDRVDIVLPEENPLGTDRYRAGSRKPRSFGSEAEDVSPLGSGSGEADTNLEEDTGDGADVRGGFGADVRGGFGADETDSEGLAELTEELAEELPQPVEAEEDRGEAIAEEESGEQWSPRAPGLRATAASGAPQNAARSGSGTGGSGSSSRATSSEEGDVRASGDAIGRGPAMSDDRDGLPDISNLEIATETNEDEPAKGVLPGRTRPEDALRGAVSGQDPATIAKAIRTVLKRDDKG